MVSVASRMAVRPWVSMMPMAFCGVLMGFSVVVEVVAGRISSRPPYNPLMATGP